MPVNLKGRSLLTLMDFTPEEIRYLIDLSKDLKSKKRMGIKNNLLAGKNIVLLFDKTSTRTRCAFEVAAFDEGANVTYLTNSQMGKKESLEDTAKVLGRFYDGIEYRGFKQQTVEDLAKYSGVPVWNGLTDVDHPTQVLADLLTIEEHIHKPLNKVKLVFVGDARNNMGYALMYGCAKMGMTYTALAPKELWADKEIMEKAQKVANETGAKIEMADSIEDIKGADVIYTDIWASMGEEDKLLERVKLLTPYKVTMDMMKATDNQDAIFMHCLPSYHDFKTDMAKGTFDNQGLDIREVEDEVFRSSYSKVFDEAENRMHTIKAVMVATL
ncbi:ornithine carbamoyltransferase [Clostridium amylolyticum]|uniref:Ornithine carbamoyltransferase n=1 Tax=Clostridium amylolyticum TaxID=1121298 RepID=A0A1M6CYY3_9CLOT|nr:ornithine carbamoyltransferase [Clostridium amylolyticum]SHI66285.1 ornithine carbamoyltransferase [Clostridium amylolyticum]